MGIQYNSRIVTDGLVLALDAANPKNYNLTAVEVLVVAGGGGGGANHAGGGGAGGLIYNSNFAVTPGSAITVTVGAGGSKSTNALYTAAGDGGNSVFGSLTAIGGGGGGNRRDSGTAGLEFGRSGGSGGGGGGQGTNDTPTSTGGSGTSGQGFAGGTASYHAGAGGGGAGGVGETTTGSIGGSTSTTFPGDGGPGLQFSISGTLQWYAGGGGGGGWIDGPYAGLGGSGIGGDGQINGSQRVNGTANTGSGGGGANGGGNANGGDGGSGIVIVRYPGPQKAIGGTVTSVGGHTIHTFTTVGSTTFTPLVATNNSAILGLSDFSGNNNFGKAENSPVYSSSFSGSVAFDGTNEYINCGSNSNLNLGAFTLSAWVKVSTDVSNYRAIIADESVGGSPWNYRLFVSQSNGIVYCDIHDGGYGSVSSTFAINNNTWYHICATRSSVGGTLSMYINGLLNNTSTDGSTRSTLGNQVWVGQSPYTGGAYPMNGNIAQVSIYNRALSAAEVSQNFNALRGRFGI
jgi:hypothetical protein